jgi:hypothetical protein
MIRRILFKPDFGGHWNVPEPRLIITKRKIVRTDALAYEAAAIARKWEGHGIPRPTLVGIVNQGLVVERFPKKLRQKTLIVSITALEREGCQLRCQVR